MLLFLVLLVWENNFFLTVLQLTHNIELYTVGVTSVLHLPTHDVMEMLRQDNNLSPGAGISGSVVGGSRCVI